MTREEAILWMRALKNSKVHWIGGEEDVITRCEEAEQEAFDMAIEALKGRPQGEWILVKGSNGKDYHKCSKCLHTQEITGVKNYCAVCGAKMGGDDE